MEYGGAFAPGEAAPWPREAESILDAGGAQKIELPDQIGDVGFGDLKTLFESL